MFSHKMGSPSQLPRVCVGPPTSLADYTQGKLNISWDPLPCHLQNGADVTVYSIQYTELPDGGPNIIDSKAECCQEPGGPYSCLAASSFFIPRVTYSFQVAARNSFGVGSFSNSVITVYDSQGNHYMYYHHNNYYAYPVIIILHNHDSGMSGLRTSIVYSVQ